MARGGIYDQVGGGFARYSVDAGWVVPHFEKMLYDNAQLLGVYARWGGNRIAEETADFLLRELRTPEGGFASALDADTEGVEGKFYAWTPAQLVEALGEDDGAWAAGDVHGHRGRHLRARRLHAPAEAGPRRPATGWRTSSGGCARPASERTRPARDDKVVAAWNGLAISGLCAAGTLMRRPDYVGAAVEAGRLLVDLHLVDGRLKRVSRDGVVGRHDGVLEDHGCVALGLPRPAPGHRRRRLARARPGWSSTTRWPGSAPTTAASTTPPPTPRPWSRGRARSPTTPARPASPRWCTPSRRTPRSPARASTASAAEQTLRGAGPAGRAGAAVRRLGAGRGRGDARGAGGDRGRRAPRRRPGTRSRTRPGAAPGRSCWSPSPVARTSRCWSAATRSTAAPAAYVCRELRLRAAGHRPGRAAA